MKKYLLFLVAAALMSGGHAATTYQVTSNITGVQFWYENIDLMTAEPGGFFSRLRFSGTAVDQNDDGIIDSSNLSMDGMFHFVVNGDQARQTFLLRNGEYSAGAGTVFKAGRIISETNPVEYGEVQEPDDSWYEYGSVDASLEWDWVKMEKGLPGHDVDYVGPHPQTTAGLLLAPGTTALPGFWDGVRGSASYDNEIAWYYQYGKPLGLYLQGTVTLTAVPLPAGAWLFATGLIGLTGAGRKRRGG